MDGSPPRARPGALNLITDVPEGLKVGQAQDAVVRTRRQR